jgi:hypothetical protein
MIKNNHIPKQKPLIISGCSGVGKVSTLLFREP